VCAVRLYRQQTPTAALLCAVIGRMDAWTHEPLFISSILLKIWMRKRWNFTEIFEIKLASLNYDRLYRPVEENGKSVFTFLR
jgi:hypothetical protein